MTSTMPDATQPAANDIRLPLTSADVLGERKERLKELFPEAFVEGQFDLDRLRNALGDFVGEGRERYGLSWAGKADAIRAIQAPSVGTLVPCPDDSVNFDTTENLFIEGDNLEVLKLLQKSYYGSVKMIYIDPPYNTGNEFIYPDNFREGLDEYLRYSGQVGEGGVKLSTNTETSGRYHSTWLDMMYPRLFLARNLLRPDGVIFVSIDDHEIHNLRLLMNEVFGEECLVGQVTVLCNPKGRSQDKYLATCHEYLLLYSRSILPKGALMVPKSEEDVEGDYPLEDEDGPYRELELRNTHREFGKHNRPNLWYPFFVKDDESVTLDKRPNSVEVWPLWDDGFEGCWTWGKEKALEEGHLLVAHKVAGRWKIFRKAYALANGEQPLKQLKSIWKEARHHTEKGQATFNELFDTKEKIFQAPKAVDVITDAVQMCGDKDAIVLDFFAGSCTSAHAVMKQNAEDQGNRHFIMVQLPEVVPPDSVAANAGYRTIAEIGRERIRRAATAIAREHPLFGAQATEHKLDLGLKCFRLTASNFKIWASAEPSGSEALAEQLELFAEHVQPGSAEQAILYELMLKAGLPLASAIQETSVTGEKVYRIADGMLAICLANPITQDCLRGIISLEPQRVICLDAAFGGNDQLKTNTVLEMKSHGIQFRTV